MWETWVRPLGWEDPLGEGKDYPLQYCGLENSMDIVHGVAKSQTQLSNFQDSQVYVSGYVLMLTVLIKLITNWDDFWLNKP